ncbi:MAG: glycosyltransferase family 4 protein [Gammaproteobacteria bacterium]|nr:glycosyltransferase family 4 protein [Gammaproteobacteria bacterium]
MKVTLTSHAANHLLRLAQGLQEQGVLNRFYTIYPQFKLVPYGIDKKYVSAFRSLAAVTFLARKMGIMMLPEKLNSDLFDGYAATMLRFDRSNPSIVQGNSGFCLKTLRVAKSRGIKTIVDRACPHIDFQLALLDEEVERLTGKSKQISVNHKLREKMLAEYDEADGIIVPSTYSCNSFIKKGFDKRKLNLVPLMKEKNVTRATENNHKKPFTVLAVGFSFYRKGFYYLLKAWRELNLPDAQLILRTTVPKEFQYMLDHKTIKFINHHLSTPDLIRAYQQCDVFCLPSIDEGFGMAAMEGMAAGKPIIVTQNVGMTDLITDKNEGFILPIRDVNAIKESISMLYENRDLGREMGEAAYLCEQKYSQARYIETILSAYNSLLE